MHADSLLNQHDGTGRNYLNMLTGIISQMIYYQLDIQHVINTIYIRKKDYNLKAAYDMINI